VSAAPAGHDLDLLAFGAHPDDVEICCGGLLASASARGHRTGIVDLTRGERGTLGTPELRAQEAARAAEILGVAVRVNLGIPDGDVFPYAGAQEPAVMAAAHQVAAVVAVLRKLRPAIVVMPWTHERHPDHEAASALLTRALFFAGVAKFPTLDSPERPFTPLQVLQYPMRYELEPSFIADVSAVADRKAAAIAAYASQFAGAPAASPAAPAPLIASPLNLPAGQARDRYFGAMIGVAAGEPYLARGPLGLADPVAHFKANPFPGALYFGRPR
jgi:bacillithiol biosynthesis deacetylase BshB1